MKPPRWLKYRGEAYYKEVFNFYLSRKLSSARDRCLKESASEGIRGYGDSAKTYRMMADEMDELMKWVIRYADALGVQLYPEGESEPGIPPAWFAI